MHSGFLPATDGRVRSPSLRSGVELCGGLGPSTRATERRGCRKARACFSRVVLARGRAASRASRRGARVFERLLDLRTTSPWLSESTTRVPPMPGQLPPAFPLSLPHHARSSCARVQPPSAPGALNLRYAGGASSPRITRDLGPDPLDLFVVVAAGREIATIGYRDVSTLRHVARAIEVTSRPRWSIPATSLTLSMWSATARRSPSPLDDSTLVHPTRAPRYRRRLGTERARLLRPSGSPRRFSAMNYGERHHHHRAFRSAPRGRRRTLRGTSQSPGEFARNHGARLRDAPHRVSENAESTTAGAFSSRTPPRRTR